MAEEGSPTAWYECTRCGACCRWAGDVCIEEDEVREIALFLEMDEQAFINECCRLRANRKGLSIKDAADGACLMLTEIGCRINPSNRASAAISPINGTFPVGGSCAVRGK